MKNHLYFCLQQKDTSQMILTSTFTFSLFRLCSESGLEDEYLAFDLEPSLFDRDLDLDDFDLDRDLDTDLDLDLDESDLEVNLLRVAMVTVSGGLTGSTTMGVSEAPAKSYWIFFVLFTGVECSTEAAGDLCSMSEACG